MSQDECNSTTIIILGLPGSIRQGSFTRRAIETALSGAADAGAQTAMFDLGQHELPFAFDHKAEYSENVRKMREAVKAADGVILGTPEYHGAVSGVLKNALDLMGFDEFEGKMLGLVGVSGGAMGAHDALNTLRTIGRALHAWVIPVQASVPEAWKVFRTNGTISDLTVEERLRQVGREVARFARLHKCEGALNFVAEWQKAPENPGGTLSS
jgi:NAD(P)H-dependent FMN reductase